MTPDGIREKFDLYRKWFKTLLITEFLNLPTKYQERFLILGQKFLDDCKRIYEEGKTVNEKLIEITVKKVVPEFLEEVMENKDTYFVFGTCPDSENEIKIVFPVNKPRPKIGEKLNHTVFSLDEIVWYSSKEELLNKGTKT